MDNAGGHRTGNAINQYTKILEGENIDIIWQVIRSTETLHDALPILLTNLTGLSSW